MPVRVRVSGSGRARASQGGGLGIGFDAGGVPHPLKASALMEAPSPTW